MTFTFKTLEKLENFKKKNWVLLFIYEYEISGFCMHNLIPIFGILFCYLCYIMIGIALGIKNHNFYKFQRTKVSIFTF